MNYTIVRMILSAIVAGALSGLLAYQAGASWKLALCAGLLIACKDAQAYLSTSPQQAQLKQSGLTAYHPPQFPEKEHNE